MLRSISIAPFAPGLVPEKSSSNEASRNILIEPHFASPENVPAQEKRSPLPPKLPVLTPQQLDPTAEGFVRNGDSRGRVELQQQSTADF